MDTRKASIRWTHCRRSTMVCEGLPQLIYTCCTGRYSWPPLGTGWRWKPGSLHCTIDQAHVSKSYLNEGPEHQLEHVLVQSSPFQALSVQRFQSYTTNECKIVLSLLWASKEWQ